MLILYIKVGCQYCAKVLKTAQELGLALDLRNVANPAVSAELCARGGKRQMPYFVDEEAKVEMYESDDIVAYLHQKFGPKE